MTDPLKKQMMENYLHQQQTASAQALVPVEEKDNISLEEFREYVRKWLELDNNIKKAQEVIKERKKVRDKLSMVISGFMCKYNIEDLNTKEGRIRCKVSTVRAPVNQKVIKQKISDYFVNDEDKQVAILNKIYEERDKVEKVSLRRLKIT
jgi:polyribonucleotide nucleotidyltransferase